MHSGSNKVFGVFQNTVIPVILLLLSFQMKSFLVVLFGLTAAPALASEVAADKEKEASTDLDGAESQSYGYGYGTKVADKYSVSTGKSMWKVPVYSHKMVLLKVQGMISYSMELLKYR